MRTLLPFALRASAAGTLLLALPAWAGWVPHPTPAIPERIQFLDWRGMGASRLTADESGSIYLYLDGPLLRARDGGTRWDTLGAFPDENRYAYVAHRPAIQVRGDWILCDRWFSLDRGKNWREDPPLLSGMMWVTLLPRNRFLGTRFYGASLWMSEDTGATFRNVGGMRPWYQEWADAGKNVYLVAGVMSSLQGMASETLYSPDAGSTWLPMVKPSGDTVVPVRAFALAADPNPARGIVYALSDSAGGARLDILTRISAGFRVGTRSVLPGIPDTAVTCFRASPLPDGGTRLWVGTWGFGIFASADGGSSWKREDKGLGDPRVADLAVSGEAVFALTPKGIYKQASPTALRGTVRRGRNGAGWKSESGTFWFRRPGPGAGAADRFRIDGRRSALPGETPDRNADPGAHR